MDQNERQASLINKDGKSLSHKEVFEGLAKESLDETIKLIEEKSFNDLIYYFSGNIARKKFDDFENGIKLFEKSNLWWHEARRSKKKQTPAKCV